MAIEFDNASRKLWGLNPSGLWTPVNTDANGNLVTSLTGSIATNAAAITPGTAFAATLALYVGGAGNLELELSSGATVTLNSVVAGTVYPLSAVNVVSAGTTATGLVALYG